MYHYHVDNLRSIQLALGQVETLAKTAIKKENPLVLASLLRTHIFLLGAWTECRLLKLIYEPVGFPPSERNSILVLKTQEGKWNKAIVLGFKRQYNVNRINGNTLSRTTLHRYDDLISALKSEIVPIIHLRNKLAHGQWKYFLNSKGTNISQRLMTVMANENLLSSKFKKKIVEHIAQIIHDLVVSNTTFERDFDTHYQLYLGAKRNLNNRSYEKYSASLLTSYQRGQRKRNEKQ